MKENAESKQPIVRRKRVDGRRHSITLPFSKKLGAIHSDDAFEYIQIIGRGAFGRVVRVRNKVDGEQYAMKMYDVRQSQSLVTLFSTCFGLSIGTGRPAMDSDYCFFEARRDGAIEVNRCGQN
jgi:serine/threonine protein kinase